MSSTGPWEPVRLLSAGSFLQEARFHPCVALLCLISRITGHLLSYVLGFPGTAFPSPDATFARLPLEADGDLSETGYFAIRRILRKAARL